MTGSGDLREVVEMQAREIGDDGYGNPVAGPFATVWSAPARIHILRGTEAVMAGRLAGKQTIAITIRWQPEVATLDTTWRAVNGRTGDEYNIRSIEPDERKAFVNLLVEKGVAT
ncbi:head-tail adaptor protein [Sinorhizobium medicae]|uniref:head-tail adaptor protein n=1 Tax=Sinorhizobium medicae TaxID=110321 RepID=UPI000FD73184|nr:head-tail adaptor protein [Sinorhizobium medicae]RVI95672.1 head-tail adaptor protein [Sinorhizobium medicae]